MSSELPRTAVPVGIADPVEHARAELKAALWAIETKTNVPKRVAKATDRGVAKAKRVARDSPGVAAAAVVGVATVVGAAVWGIVRLLSR
ncbi:hypothetical protein [Microbacterium sp.]|uniref:hypothetical protein n=1 Tax=Microbacterium sp. TaxID=51671 RepID=UPI003A8450EE